MKKSIKQFFSVFLSVCLIFSCFTFGGASVVNASQEDDRAQLQEKLDQIDAKIADLEKQGSDTMDYVNALNERLNYLEKQYSLAEQEAKDTNDKVEKLESSIENNKITLTQTQEDISSLEKDADKLQEEFNETYVGYSKRMRALYVSGNLESVLTFVLDSDSLSNLLTRMEMVASVSRRDNKLMKKVKSECDAIIKTQNELKQKQEDLTKTQNILISDTANLKVQKVNLADKQKEMKSKSETIESQKKEANKTLDKIGKEKGIYTEYHELTQADIDALDKLIADQDKKYPETTTTTTKPSTTKPSGSGNHNTTTTTTKPSSSSRYISMTYPCPSYKSITCGFGEYYGHTGCDFSTGGNVNQKVVAAESGTVIISRDITCNRNTCGKSYHGGGYCSYGRYIVIRHDKPNKSGKTVYTLYAHNNARYVSEGNYVSKGQQIAASGSTGNSTGPHLHFEVRVGGSSQSYAVNPAYYLP